MDYAALKREFGAICVIPIGTYEIFFRPLSWEEADIYNKVISLGLVPEGQLAAKLFKDICLNFDLVDLMNSLPAGIIYTFFRVVLHISTNDLRDESGIARFNEDLHVMRTSIDKNPYENMVLTICKAFPSYNPTTLVKLPYYEVLRLMAMSERILELEPYKITLKRNHKGLTDQIFEDARRAQNFDRSKGSSTNIKDLIEQRQAQKEGGIHRGLNPAQQEAIQRVLAERKR